MSSGIWTLFAMLAFVAIAIWVFLIKDRKDFEEQANMPLDDDDSGTQKDKERTS
ncbi:cbb3-type cytochrome oxidase subunit 3 [Wenzhouxiangella marina]|uniref:Uncharacterized protein n=1 Tax=Wenzhouxiangella marina TaxID=1579979 RepID=A0A0K0XZQ8_9GAMM|nr:cbb3-type cytochrome c oxidase subunit 3 [Wenzhouxiangella marina]AKS43106.1 hypothetical protein WM2015_2749 [Wenzhouxiangella marina]MBB6087209.1 cbb3-type cytochrome oxidase subunit 3 [Wenzhouxiangella marina]